MWERVKILDIEKTVTLLVKRVAHLEERKDHNDVMSALHDLSAHLALEVKSMAKTLDEILAQQAEVMQKVQANTDATAAVAAVIEELKAEIVALNEQLAAAGTDPEKLQQVSDNLTSLANSIDADTIAETALANTPAT